MTSCSEINYTRYRENPFTSAAGTLFHRWREIRCYRAPIGVWDSLGTGNDAIECGDKELLYPAHRLTTNLQTRALSIWRNTVF